MAIIGNTTATPYPRPDWEQKNETKADYIKNKPDKLVNSINEKTGVVTLDYTDVGAVPTGRTINNKALTSDITLSYEDVEADPEGSATNALSEAKSYTDTKIADLINGAPETLNTLGEIASAMKNDKDIVDVLEQAIGNKQNTLTFDNKPIENSTNPVTSNGVYNATKGLNGLTFAVAHSVPTVDDRSIITFVIEE